MISTYRIEVFAIGAALMAPMAPAAAQSFVVERADEWTALFDRDSGWTGADGIYSIPLDGDDSFNSAAGGATAFVFSDSVIGDVDQNGRRLPGTVMINNTIAVLRGGEPDPNRIDFYWRREGGQPASVFVPQTPNSQPDEWYWLGDGFTIDGVTRLFAYRIRSTGGGGVFGFEGVGVSLIILPPGSRPPFRDQIQIDTPLFVPGNDDVGSTEFGGAVLVNTVEAGAPNPDGYVYVYGTRNDPFVKKLLAARVEPDRFEDFDAWRFWDGSEWVSGITNAAPITGRVSNEHSVTPLPNGKYLLAFQKDAIGRDVAIRIGESPVGPFGPVRSIYTCPEPSFDDDWFTYNAKAHPHLSKPGELLISYNVNTMDFFGDFFNNADSYRPRFIRLRYVDDR